MGRLKNKPGKLLACCIGLLLCSPAIGSAVEYRGYLLGPTGSPLNGQYDLTFTLYEGRDSNIVWVEKHNNVKVSSGNYQVDLGSVSSFESADIQWNMIHFLGVRAGEGNEQKPRKLFKGPPVTASAQSTAPANRPTKALQENTATAAPAPANTRITTPAASPAVAIGVPSVALATSASQSGVSEREFQQHAHNKTNPHSVTAEQIGAARQKDILSHTQDPLAHHRKTKSFKELEDTIGSGQIAANTITGKQIRNASIKAEDIADKAISARKIKAGAGSGLDADLIDGMQANEIIAAARDEVRIPISALPFSITKPGSYYLTTDLKVAQQHGITVKASNVSINLMGFSIIGDGSKFNGINLDGTHNVSVRDGTIRGFGAAGIFTSSGDGHRIMHVRAINNGSGGLFIFSSGSLVSDCLASGNKSVGIATGPNSMVRNCVSRSNLGNGISAESGSTIIANTVFGNQGEFGISATGSTIRDNSVDGNADTGIYAGASTVIGNTIANNTGWGIKVLDGSTVLTNTISLNNSADTPGKGGVSVGDDCQIKGNTVISNKQNNIHVSGSDNTIEENLVTDSLGGNGINFAHPANGPQNFYANNRASGNGKNYAGSLPTGKANGGGNASF